MKILSKYAELVGYVVYHGESFEEWRCPDKDCGMSVSEDFQYCPYCGRKLKFKQPERSNMVSIFQKQERDNL